MAKSPVFFITLFLWFSTVAFAQETIFPGADERTPSRAQYFSWINNTNEGTTETHTLINLDFFQWLYDEYGMTLDIYAFDAGAIDGKNFYGSIYSDRFKKQFPRSFDPIYQKAKGMGTRLGVWGGPDGFGETQEEELARHEQMVKLCRDYDFALFKFDAVCGPLRPEKEDAFIRMMTESRTYSPDLILLNHRLGLNKAKPYATTFLWEGSETYIDVFMNNNMTAPHHRARALSRGTVPGLQRLTEDHGVCISSCLDYWDDDLVLQAFNRSLILAPQVYGNPWLLRDDEFPKLARIYNLHRRYRDILVDGKLLPDSYGPHAVARGDDRQRLLTLRNLDWAAATYTIQLDTTIGLTEGERIEVRQFHPREEVLGYFDYGEEVDIIVPAFRSCLLYVGAEPCAEPAVTGAPFQVIQEVPGKLVVIEVLGLPGTTATIRLPDHQDYRSALLAGNSVPALVQGKATDITFPGKPLNNLYHRKLADMTEAPLPADAAALYEATVFAADNNALEVRSIQRSGWSEQPAVRNAQEAFFSQEVFVNRGIWDKNLFDGDPATGFRTSYKYRRDQGVEGGCFRLDLGAVTPVDEIVIKVPDYFSLEPLLKGEGRFAQVSRDLIHWETLTFLGDTTSRITVYDSIRYLKLDYFPRNIVEVEGYRNGQPLPRDNWRASNLFAPAEKMQVQKAWSTAFSLDEIPKGSYLCIAVNGEHGVEGAYAALKVDGQLMGCPDRAVSFPSNTWEYINARSDRNYTYYFPLTDEMKAKFIEVFVLAYQEGKTDLKPEVWITAYPAPWEKQRLVLERRP